MFSKDINSKGKSKLEELSRLRNKDQVGKELGFNTDTINEKSREGLQKQMEEAVEKQGLDSVTIEAGKMGSGGKQTFYGNNKNKFDTIKQAQAAGIKTPKKYVKRKNGDYVLFAVKNPTTGLYHATPRIRTNINKIEKKYS